jgi:hypothetical protein
LRALALLDKQVFFNRPMRVVWHDKKAIGAEKKPEANVFIKNLNQKVPYSSKILFFNVDELRLRAVLRIRIRDPVPF